MINLNLTPVDIARDLSKLVCTTAKKHRSIGLWDHKSAYNPYRTRAGGKEAYNPSLASVHTQKSTDNRAQNRSKERSCSENTHGNTSLLRGKYICDKAAGVSKRRRPKGTGEETKGDKGPAILCTGSTSIENREGAVGHGEKNLTPEQFT